MKTIDVKVTMFEAGDWVRFKANTLRKGSYEVKTIDPAASDREHHQYLWLDGGKNGGPFLARSDEVELSRPPEPNKESIKDVVKVGDLLYAGGQTFFAVPADAALGNPKKLSEVRRLLNALMTAEWYKIVPLHGFKATKEDVANFKVGQFERGYFFEGNSPHNAIQNCLLKGTCDITEFVSVYKRVDSADDSWIDFVGVFRVAVSIVADRLF